MKKTAVDPQYDGVKLKTLTNTAKYLPVFLRKYTFNFHKISTKNGLF